MHLVHEHNETGIGLTIALSVALHAAVFVFLVWWQQYMPPLGAAETTYYVDMVNLPVANPAAGVPSAPPAEPAQSLPKPSPPAAFSQAARAMRYPAVKGKSAVSDKQTQAAESEAFEENLAKLEGKAEAQHQAAAIEKLRKRVAAKKEKPGIPKGNGTESGSDYTAYLYSRLKDAFDVTISFQSKNPFVLVRLTIDGEGRVIRSRIENSSGDRVFELSVTRAIVLAERTIAPPPNRAVYEGAFVFRPSGVTRK